MFKNSELRNVRLFVGDDQRITHPWWFDQMKRDTPNVMDFVSGIAVHWYWDRIAPPSLLDKTHEKYPDMILLNTESALGDKPWETHGPILGQWSRAEKYALGIIQDFEHHVIYHHLYTLNAFPLNYSFHMNFYEFLVLGRRLD